MSALDDFISSPSTAGESSDSSSSFLDSFIKTPVSAAPTKTAPTSLDTFLTTPTPKVTPIPAPIESPYFQGKEPTGTFMGISDEVDPYSGRPYLAYRTQGATSTTTDKTRTAPKMNPEVSAPTAKANFENPRMPESASQKIRANQGATSGEQLDHSMALAIGGSNDKSNLKLVPTSQNQAASKNEGAAVGKVASGQESLFEAQRQEAKDKGLPMPFTDQEIQQQGPGWLQTFLKGGEAAGHAILSAAVTIPNGLEKIKEYFTGPAPSPMANWKQNINPNFNLQDAQDEQTAKESGYTFPLPANTTPASIKETLTTSLPFTNSAKNLINKDVTIQYGNLPTGVGGQTDLPSVRPLAGQDGSPTQVTITPGSTPSEVAHELFHTLFLRSGIDPVAFNKQWDAAAANNPDMKGLDASLNNPDTAAAYHGNGEDIATNPYMLATERFALMGSTWGKDGISSLPTQLQQYYKPYLQDSTSDNKVDITAPLTVKYPFSHDVGTEIPNNLGGMAVKGLVELPETAVKTLQEGFNALQGKTTAPDTGAYPITSDPQTAFNDFHDQVIASGGDEMTADWAATMGAFGAGVLALTPLESLISGGVRAIGARAAPTTEEQIAAHVLLGSPTTMEEAKAAQLKALHLIGQGPGSSQEAAATVNSAYQLLQETGIPNQGILQRGARFAQTLIQPMKFSDIPGMMEGKAPAGYQWANPDRRLPGYRSLTPTAPKMGLQMEPVERVGGAPAEEPITPYDTPGVIKARAEAEGKTPTNEIDTPERQALRQKIGDEVYGTGAAVKGKRLDIVSGGPGTRKSSMVAEPLAKEHGSFVADSDAIKPKLPEYGKGEGAPQVHKESAVINYKNMLKAMKNGDNIVYPTVASSAKRLQDVIDLFKQNGYDVHLHHVSLPVETATRGVVDRFEKGGQFIDPAYIPGATLQSNKTYAIMKSYGGLTSSRYLSTEVPKSEQPRVIERRGESGGRSAEVRGGLDQGGSGRTPIRVRGSDRTEPVPSPEIARLHGDESDISLHRPVRIYGDLEASKTRAARAQGYYEYRADVTKTGAETPVAAHPELNKKGNPIARLDIPKAIDALKQAYYGSITSGPFKGFDPEVRDWFQNFVWRSRNSGIESRVAMKTFKNHIGAASFEELQKESMQGLHDYDGVPLKVDGKLQFDSAGNQKFKVPPRRDGAYGALADLYKELYDKEVEAGVPVREKQNYQPVRGIQKVEKAEKGIKGLVGRIIGLRPGFTMTREYDTHLELMQHGGVPLFDNLIDNLSNRLNEHFTAMAKAQFWNEGVQTGYIMPTEFVKNNEKLILKEFPNAEITSLNPDRVPSRTTSYQTRDSSVEKVNTYGWMSPKPISRLVNNYLAQPETFTEKLFHNLARGSAATRNFVLGVGIPKTALNVHYFNILPREVSSDLFAGKMGGITGELARTVGWTLYPTAAARFIETNLERAIPLYRAGMMFSSHPGALKPLPEDSTLLEKAGRGFQIASNAWHRWFGGNLFDSFIPARMMQNGMRAAQKYIEQGMSEGDAYKRAATEMNILYGNLDAEALGKDKFFRNVIRSVALAPSYTVNNLAQLPPKMLMGAWQELKGISKPIEPGTENYSIYAKYMYFMLGLYTVSNVINYENSGHLMWENDPLHQFDIDFGKDTNGKTRYVGVVGTGADWLRLPLEIAAAVAQGKPQDIPQSIRNRMSTFVGPLVSLATNSDWKGDPIVGPDKYGKPQSPLTQVINIFNNTVGVQLPGQYQTVVGALGGKQSVEQTIASIAGIPLKYKNENPTQADLNALAAAGPKAQAVADIKPTYEQVQKLVASGDTAGAQKIIDGLTDTQYAAYKTYKAAQTSATTKKNEADMIPQYQTIQALIKKGDTAGAQAQIDAMSDAQYKTYTQLKKRLGGQ